MGTALLILPTLISNFLKGLTYSAVCDVGVPFCRQVRWDIWSKQIAEISCDIDIEFDMSSHFEFKARILVLFTWDCQHKKSIRLWDHVLCV